jgi:two-component system, response regulator YesN
MIKIILIEDDSIMSSAVRLHLKVILEFEYTIKVFGNVNSALDYMKDNPCDILISDINLPDSKGNDTIKEFSNLPEHTNIIFMSGSSEDIESLDLKNHQNTHFIMKDMDFNESMWHVFTKKLKLKTV